MRVLLGVLAVTALVGGPAIPGKLCDYLENTAEQTKEWITLLTELQVFINWTKVERSRPAVVKDIAEKWTPAEKPAAATSSRRPKSSKKRARLELEEEEVSIDDA